MNFKMKLIIRAVVLISFCFALGLTATQEAKAQNKVKPPKMGVSKKERPKVTYARILEANAQKSTKANKKAEKVKPGTHTVEGLVAVKSKRPVIQYKRTGDPVKDKAAYLAAKKKWIAEHPEQYQQIISKKN